jgi:hypothetical protein
VRITADGPKPKKIPKAEGIKRHNRGAIITMI